MGKRGPKPIPKAILQARGSRKAVSRAGEPDPVEGVPIKPLWLGQIASQKWDEVVPGLIAQGVMAAMYGDFIAMYCLAHQDLHEAMDILREEGMTCTSEKGGAYQHPAVAIKQNAIERIARFGKEFGLSASSIRDVVKTPGKQVKKTLSSAARNR